MKGKLGEKDSQIRDLNDKVSKLQSELNKNLKDIEMMKKENSTLTDELEKAKNNLKSVENVLSGDKQKYMNEIEILKEKLKEHHSRTLRPFLSILQHQDCFCTF